VRRRKQHCKSGIQLLDKRRLKGVNTIWAFACRDIVKLYEVVCRIHRIVTNLSTSLR